MRYARLLKETAGRSLAAALRIRNVAVVFAAATLPCLLAWLFVVARIGGEDEHKSGSLLSSVPVPLEHVPGDWMLLQYATDSQKYLGFQRISFTPGKAPGCWECEVKLWQIRAGFPLLCMEAYWAQDNRGDPYLAVESLLYKSVDSDDEIKHSYSNQERRTAFSGLNIPQSIDAAPSRYWLPARPLAIPYFINAAFYFACVSFIAACAKHACKMVVFAHRRSRGHCRNCNYNLSGLSSMRCPECGTSCATATWATADDVDSGAVPSVGQHSVLWPGSRVTGALRDTRRAARAS